jgi:purine-binding chemotaxis protein CheW
LNQAPQERGDIQEDLFLTFCLADEVFGLDISHVVEVLGLPDITTIPGMPNDIKGIASPRGKAVPVLDMRSMLGMEERSHDDHSCLISLNIDGHTAGLVVDRIGEVLKIPPFQVAPPPRLGGSRLREIKGIGKVGKAIVILLDLRTLFEEPALRRP